MIAQFAQFGMSEVDWAHGRSVGDRTPSLRARWHTSPRVTSPGLAAAVARARAIHPAIAVSDEIFVRWVEERLIARESVDLSALHMADLLVACGCAHRDAAALSQFEADHMPTVTAAVRAAGIPSTDIDEVRQRVRERILVGRSDGPAKITAYGGTGPLRGWLRVCAVREALMLHRQPRQPSLDEALMSDLVEPIDPELEIIKRDVSAAFKAAFAQSLAELPERERDVLRYHVLDGLSTEQVARLFRVHRVTVTRWIARARERLLRETRKRLTLELRLDHRQFESMMKLIESRMDLSLSDLRIDDEITD